MNKLRYPLLGAAYYPEDWDEAEQAHDISMMVRAGINVVRIGEFAWAKMEPREGKYDFSWLHRVMEKLDRAGIRVILGTPSATPPNWVEEKDPEMRLLDDVGLRHDHGGRRHCCSNNPAYIHYSLKIAEAMAKEFGADPRVIGWQIDNEIAAFDYGCFCPHCISAFREHLKARYGTIEELNRRWNCNIFSQWYDSFDQVPQPKPHTWHNPHLKFEWATFHSQSHVRFVNAQAEILHRYTSAPVGTDMMPVFNQDYEAMNEHMDVVQYNHYDDEYNLKREVFWFDYMRPLKPRPFWVTETLTCWNGATSTPSNLRPEGYCGANSWLPIVLGAEANMYWLWRQHWAGHELMHGAMLYPSGRPMHTFEEVQKVAAGFEKCEEFLTGTRVKTDLAMIASSRVDFLMKQQEVVWEGGHQWETPYCRRLYRIYDGIAEIGARPDVLTPGANFSKYKYLLTPFLLTLEECDLPQRIERWVRDGGIWIAGPMADIRDDIGAHYRDRETGILERLTESTLTYQIPDAEHRVPCRWADGSEFKAEKYLQLFDVPEGVEVLAHADGYHSNFVGKALVFRKQVGKGQIWVLGAEPGKEDLVKLLRMILKDSPQLKKQGTVAAAFREGEGIQGIAAQEYGGSEGRLFLDGCYLELLTNTEYKNEVPIAPWQTAILKKK